MPSIRCNSANYIFSFVCVLSRLDQQTQTRLNISSTGMNLCQQTLFIMVVRSTARCDEALQGRGNREPWRDW